MKEEIVRIFYLDDGEPTWFSIKPRKLDRDPDYYIEAIDLFAKKIRKFYLSKIQSWVPEREFQYVSACGD